MAERTGLDSPSARYACGGDTPLHSQRFGGTLFAKSAPYRTYGPKNSGNRLAILVSVCFHQYFTTPDNKKQQFSAGLIKYAFVAAFGPLRSISHTTVPKLYHAHPRAGGHPIHGFHRTQFELFLKF